ncbi:MAG: phosphatidate cytidylyltransferase [Cyanobacteria bacterium P01_D01_bin.105]
MDTHILLHFYVVGLFFYGLFLCIAIAIHKQELIYRTSTLLLLLHSVCLALSQGALGWRIWVCSILAIGGYELCKQYQLGMISAVAIGIGLFVTGFYGQPRLAAHPALMEMMILPVCISTVGITVFPKEILKKVACLPAVIGFFLVPCALLLMGLANLELGFVLAPLASVQFNDSFSYLSGKKFGKTHLFPNMSPNKTLEGYLLGSSGIVLALVLLHTYLPVIHTHLLQDIVLFLGVFTIGNAGDLIFSCLKRKLETKDFGTLLPGHGGMLDRFDSLLFIAPFFFFLANHHLL